MRIKIQFIVIRNFDKSITINNKDIDVEFVDNCIVLLTSIWRCNNSE